MSRFGGYKRGKYSIFSDWGNMRASSANPALAAPASALEIDYSKTKGIWSLTSTVQFAKPAYEAPPSYVVGLSDSLDTITGQTGVWASRNVDISEYAGATVRLVFNYQNGSSYVGDLQIDNIVIDGNVFSFENANHSFETSVSGESNYSSVAWNSLPIGTTTARWNVDAGGTPSGNTGLTTAASGSYYVYAETSSPANVTGYNFWLRSPSITLGSSPTLSYSEGRLGTGIGTLNVYLDVIS